MHKLKFRNPDARFNICGSLSHFSSIVLDLHNNAGDLSPSDHWNWNLGNSGKSFAGYSNELFRDKYDHLEKMLNPWVGVTGMKHINESSVEKYENFLHSIDHLNILPDGILEHGKLNGWRETDLGSIQDINLIMAFLDIPVSLEKLSICEIGGGYGRLAEVFFQIVNNPIHYVLIDSVPGSLMYAYLYLRSQFPELKIGSYYEGHNYDTSYACYILPSWRTDILSNCSFDICVNIESMQEMEQHHVDYYLQLFDRLIRQSGQIYLSNARDYVFKGIWNIPNSWETLYLNNTPRSWTANHPTHILRKARGNYRVQRSILEMAFEDQILLWHQKQQIHEMELHIRDRDRICGELQAEIDRLMSTHS